jgi:hypothetical protein
MSETAEMLFLVREIQVFVPSRHEQLIVRSRIPSPGCRIRTVKCCRYPPPKHNAGKCNRGCYAHFKPPPTLFLPPLLTSSRFIRNVTVGQYSKWHGAPYNICEGWLVPSTNSRTRPQTRDCLRTDLDWLCKGPSDSEGRIWENRAF